MSQLSLDRNATGYIYKVNGMGPVMLQWLSEHYNFT